jgi:hypothetical protein
MRVGTRRFVFGQVKVSRGLDIEVLAGGDVPNITKQGYVRSLTQALNVPTLGPRITIGIKISQPRPTAGAALRKVDNEFRDFQRIKATWRG